MPPPPGHMGLLFGWKHRIPIIIITCCKSGTSSADFLSAVGDEPSNGTKSLGSHGGMRVEILGLPSTF